MSGPFLGNRKPRQLVVSAFVTKAVFLFTSKSRKIEINDLFFLFFFFLFILEMGFSCVVVAGCVDETSL